MLLVCYIFVALLIVCEAGQRSTDLLASFTDPMEQFDWHLHPLAMNRMFINVVMNIQQPVEFKCFGSIAANRDSFKKVVFNSLQLTRQLVLKSSQDFHVICLLKGRIFIFYNASKFHQLIFIV